MVMLHTSMQDSPSISRKLVGGIGLLVFVGALFVVPLCAALAICSMPCCEHGEQNGRVSVASADMIACETACTIRSKDAAPALSPLALDKGSDRHAPVLIALADVAARPAAPASAASSHSAGFLHLSDTPLHVLNSVFRI